MPAKHANDAKGEGMGRLNCGLGNGWRLAQTPYNRDAPTEWGGLMGRDGARPSIYWEGDESSGDSFFLRASEFALQCGGLFGGVNAG